MHRLDPQVKKIIWVSIDLDLFIQIINKKISSAPK